MGVATPAAVFSEGPRVGSTFMAGPALRSNPTWVGDNCRSDTGVRAPQLNVSDPVVVRVLVAALCGPLGFFTDPAMVCGCVTSGRLHLDGDTVSTLHGKGGMCARPGMGLYAFIMVWSLHRGVGPVTGPQMPWQEQMGHVDTGPFCASP